MRPLALAIDAQYRTDGYAARYLPAGAEPDAGFDCTVLLDRRDQRVDGLGLGADHEGPIAHVRIHELLSPAEGGQLTIQLDPLVPASTVTYLLSDAPVIADPEQYQWELRLRRNIT
ncbi:MAG: hypothetical protein CL484_07560 [Acidobacteria bacterium]|nr:hypothetical protein [Acidobacteriota bacterium]|tara:strand:+ start:1408 stop:1755 length:348 start_codon:yes stop_codon:yes gene_type:complete